ncbi:MAG TPA: hypothetical protein VMV79_03485, partial [Alphaproteobacteria bacterium]|nr:hypothetical protein [Alphaproteobacteria bacterium]
LERAGLAREEAERLAGTLDAQTRSLDDFSNTMPVRVSEAEAVLRGVADRLYASEQLAREQAVALGEKLARQIDSLQGTLDGFTTRVGGIDSTLAQRRVDLDGLISRIGETAETFSQRWENSIVDLSDRTKESLGRFSAVNEEARRGVDQVASQLSVTTERYENAANRMQNLSMDSSAQLKSITGEIAAQLAQFESLREASRQAGQDVETRAQAATQNLQTMIERLLAAREATQGVGGTLIKDLHAAVDQNEQLIGRLNEAAQMSVRALGIAAESLGRQQGEVAGQTRAAEAMLQEAIAQTETRAKAAEKGLREQAQGLMVLLAEAQDKMDSTDRKMQDFAVRSGQPVKDAIDHIDRSAEQGLQSLSRYGQGLQEQLGRLQQFSSQVGGMGQELGRVTVETLTSIEQLSVRFTSARSAQEDTARQTLDQFASMADRLQREVAGLGDQTSQAVTTLQHAAAKVGEQSQQLLQDAQNSGAQMQTVTSALQNEASQIRSILQKQADDLGADLSRAEKQFAVLGDALKQRTDAAYTLLDRVAVHYNEVTRAAAVDLDARIERFEETAEKAQSRAESFTAALTQQLSVIGNGAAQLDTNAATVAASGGKAVQQLATVAEKLAITHEAANTNAQQTLARLEESNNAFLRQSGSLAEAAQTSVTLIQKAGMTFGEQAGKMLDTSHQTEQHIRNLTASTMALSEQSGQIRTSMEQQNQRLLTQLGEAVAQLEAGERQLQQAVAAATGGADKAATRFAEMTESASTQLAGSEKAIGDIANRAESTLVTLGSNIAEQTAALTRAGEQLGEQHRTITAANENQRTQLVDLFDKLGGAHEQASEVAARTITHLNEALVQIQRHLGALGDQSQSAIASVRTASSGFADQSGILLQNAQQAEQQARTVLSVTSALQDQARQLREALHGETERTSDMLGGLISKLSVGGIEVRDLGSNTEMALTSLQNNLAQQSMALTATMQQIGERQRSLTVALDAQRDVLNGLLSRLNLAQDETAATAERTAARLGDGTQQITRQLESIEEQAKDTLASVNAASTGFADQAGSLGLHAQQAEQQMRAVLSVTAGMQEQARQMREQMQGETSRVIEQMNAIIAQLENAGSTLKQQSGAAVHIIDQSAMQVETATRASGEQLQKYADNLAEAARQTDARLEGSDEKLRGHLRLVTEAGEQAERQARQMAEASEQAVGRIAELRTGMADSDQEGRTLLTQLGIRIDEVKAALQSELQRFADASETAARQVVAAAEGLTGQSDILRANLASSESALGEAAQLVRDETVQIPATLDRSTSQIQAAVAVLKEQAKDADQTLVGTADRFISVTGNARAALADEMRHIGAAVAEADQTLRQYNASLATQVGDIKGSMGEMSAGQKELVAAASSSMAHLAQASDRLTQLRGEAAVTAEKLAQEFGTLEARATAASRNLAQAGDGVARHIEELGSVAQAAEGKLLSASSTFREQLERIKGGVQGQIDDINRGLMQITAQLERTGSALRSTTAGTVADVEKISQRFDQTSKEAAAQLVDKTARMRVSTEEVAKLLSGFGDQLDVLLDRLSMAGDGIKRHEGDLVGQMQTALTHLGSVAERLETSRKLAGNVSEQAVARLSEVSGVLEKQMASISDGSQTITGLLRNVNQVCGDQTQSLGKGVSEAQTQVLAMNKSVEDMQQRTDRLRVSLKLQGEELMNALAQIQRQLAETGDAMAETVDHVLQDQAAQSMKKIG